MLTLQSNGGRSIFALCECTFDGFCALFECKVCLKRGGGEGGDIRWRRCHLRSGMLLHRAGVRANAFELARLANRLPAAFAMQPKVCRKLALALFTAEVPPTSPALMTRADAGCWALASCGFSCQPPLQGH
jgi:hypothetical protein